MSHDLTSETLAYLEFQRDDKLRVDANRTAMGMVPTDAWRKDAAMYAHAAECVRKVKQMEDADCVLITNTALNDMTAELATLRAKAEIVDAMAEAVEYVTDAEPKWANYFQPHLTAYAQARAAQGGADAAL